MPAWQRVPLHLLNTPSSFPTLRTYSTKSPETSNASKPPKTEKSNIPDLFSTRLPELTHLTPQGTAHMVSISSKDITTRTAVARCSVNFSNSTAPNLIKSNSIKKGDVLSVARIAGIMAAKKTPDLIPLCHPIMITHVAVELSLWRGDQQIRLHKPAYDSYSFRWAQFQKDQTDKQEKDAGLARVEIEATVSCDGKTGVEMEALAAASTAALTVYDMCKAVDKGMRVVDLRVVRKEGGKSGTWVEGESVDEEAEKEK